MDILKLQKENLIESTITSGNRNEIIYNEIIKRKELIQFNINYYLNKDTTKLEELTIVKELLLRKGMYVFLLTKHEKAFLKTIESIKKELDIIDSIEEDFNVVEVNDSFQLRIGDNIIKEEKSISIFDVLKQYLEEPDNNNIDLFILSVYLLHNPHQDRIFLAWFF